jgi:hypothetical protein
MPGEREREDRGREMREEERSRGGQEVKSLGPIYESTVFSSELA